MLDAGQNIRLLFRVVLVDARGGVVDFLGELLHLGDGGSTRDILSVLLAGFTLGVLRCIRVYFLLLNQVVVGR